eukprot:6041784-Prymnesium_polylepis.1
MDDAKACEERGSAAPLAAVSRAAAAAAGLPPIDAQNAASYRPPALKDLRGRQRQAERNALDGKPMLWYFQVTGREWDLEKASYDSAK